MLELYTAEFLPLVVGPGRTSLSAPINEDEIYVLHAVGESPLALVVDVIDPPDETDFSLLDVNTDGLVTAIDALLIINHLNQQGSGPAGALTHLDPNGDGIIAPLDALLVINDLNQRLTGGDGEGESLGTRSETNPAAVLEASLGAVLDESWLPMPRPAWTHVRREHQRPLRDLDRRGCPDPSSEHLQISFPADSESHDVRRRQDVHQAERKFETDSLEDEFEDILLDIAGDIDKWWWKRGS